MSGETLVYKSDPKSGTYSFDKHDVSYQNGIECTWTVEMKQQRKSYFLICTWSFDWNQLKNFDADSLIGTITVTSSAFATSMFDVKLTQPVQTISHCAFCNTSPPQVTFEYSLTPHYTSYQEVSREELFGSSEQNNTILVFSGKKLHVNKTFLSFHSEFFRALFSSNYKEGSMSEIPIEDVSYEDFGLLLSSVYPKTVFPNDKTVENLLELADRFLMPSVIGVVEYHLICNTEIANEKLMLMVDKYGMKQLLKKTVREINTAEKTKLLKKSFVCKELSMNAKSMLFDRIMHWMKLCSVRKAKFLALFLHPDKLCQDGCWSIDTEFEFKLMSVNGRVITRNGINTFRSSSEKKYADANGWLSFIEWDQMEKDYKLDDKIFVSARVKIMKTTGINKNQLRIFDETVSQFSDVVLTVEDKKFYVSKLFLASQSTYFKSLFLGSFEESKKSEISLADVNSDDFQNFLEVLHGESAINDDNIDGILKLVDMYDAPTAFKRCEEFLIEKSQKSLKTKLLMSIRNKMNKLQNFCLVKIKTKEDIRSVLPGSLNELGESVSSYLLHLFASFE